MINKGKYKQEEKGEEKNSQPVYLIKKPHTTKMKKTH